MKFIKNAESATGLHTYYTMLTVAHNYVSHKASHYKLVSVCALISYKIINQLNHEGKAYRRVLAKNDVVIIIAFSFMFI